MTYQAVSIMLVPVMILQRNGNGCTGRGDPTVSGGPDTLGRVGAFLAALLLFPLLHLVLELLGWEVWR